jgi:hypothetical protein
MQAQATIDQLHLETNIVVAGIRCKVLTNSCCLLELFEEFPQADGRSWAITLRFYVTDDEPTSPAKPHFRGLNHIVIASFSAVDRFVFDLRRRVLTGSVSRSLANNPAFWKQTLIPICMGVMGPTVGLVPVHCACLSVIGRGVLLAGASGAGKSTLTVAVAKAGAALISDDWTYVSHKDRKLLAHGLRVPVKLLPDAIRYFRELHALEPHVSMNGELAYEFDPAKVMKTTVLDRCFPLQLVFIERSRFNDFRQMTPELASAYFTTNAERLPEQLPEASKSRHDVLNRLSGLPCYVFRYTGSPQDGAAMLIDQLTRVRESA